MNRGFSPSRFKSVMEYIPHPLIKGNPVCIYEIASNSIGRPLIDHAFIVDEACVWGGEDLAGHEIAVISRTYANNNEIDNPPSGLKIVRLPKKVMSKNDKGTAIAIVIDDITKESIEFLQCFRYLPTNEVWKVLPLPLLIKGFRVYLSVNSFSPSWVKLGIINIHNKSLMECEDNL